MRRLATTLLAGALLLFTPALPQASATADCREGGRGDTGGGSVIVGAEWCQSGNNNSGGNNSGGNNNGGNYNGNNGGTTGGQSESGDSTSSGPRMYTMEEVIEICMRDGDALSISCMAAYNDRIIREDDATEDAPADETPAQAIARARITAISRLDLSRPEIGASPCQTDTGACRGTVGLPVWLWVGDGTGGALPSMSTTATAGPYSVTATAKVSKVKWSLGDGTTTTCTTTGTKYDSATHGWSDPTCGFASGWSTAGTHTLTASYVWEISISGDATGSATQTMSSTEQVTVGELQSVVTPKG